MRKAAQVFIILWAVAGPTGCSTSGPKSPKKKMCAHRDDPTTREYVVVLKGFTKVFDQRIGKEIHGKFFELADKGGISKSPPKPGAHGFVVGGKATGACVIEVMGSKHNAPDKSVNIQMFIIEQGKKRRVYNPGTFNVTKMLAATKTSNIHRLIANLVVKLTFK